MQWVKRIKIAREYNLGTLLATRSQAFRYAAINQHVNNQT